MVLDGNNSIETGRNEVIGRFGGGVVIMKMGGRRMKWLEMFDWKELENTRARARQQL